MLCFYAVRTLSLRDKVVTFEYLKRCFDVSNSTKLSKLPSAKSSNLSQISYLVLSPLTFPKL